MCCKIMSWTELSERLTRDSVMPVETLTLLLSTSIPIVTKIVLFGLHGNDITAKGQTL
jgi:hypothetical protein